MPLYDYECRRHGPFSDWHAMSEFENPAPCPVCGATWAAAPSRRPISVLILVCGRLTASMKRARTSRGWFAAAAAIRFPHGRASRFDAGRPSQRIAWTLSRWPCPCERGFEHSVARITHGWFVTDQDEHEVT